MIIIIIIRLDKSWTNRLTAFSIQASHEQMNPQDHAHCRSAVVALSTVDEDKGARIRQHVAESHQAAIMEKDLACDFFELIKLIN